MVDTRRAVTADETPDDYDAADDFDRIDDERQTRAELRWAQGGE